MDEAGFAILSGRIEAQRRAELLTHPLLTVTGDAAYYLLDDALVAEARRSFIRRVPADEPVFASPSALLRQGHIAALAPEGALGIDILISDPTGQSLSAIQVKATRNAGKNGWQMDQKHETFDSGRLYYVFQNFSDSEDKMPESWVVPSAVVAEHVRTTHQAWLQQGIDEGLTRNDGPKRSFPR